MKSPTTSWMKSTQPALAAWVFVASLLAGGCSSMPGHVRNSLHQRVCPTCSARTIEDCHCFRPAEKAGYCETNWHSLEPTYTDYTVDVLDYAHSTNPPRDLRPENEDVLQPTAQDTLATGLVRGRWDDVNTTQEVKGTRLMPGTRVQSDKSRDDSVQLASHDVSTPPSIGSSSAYITDKPRSDERTSDLNAQAVIEKHEAYFRP